MQTPASLLLFYALLARGVFQPNSQFLLAPLVKTIPGMSFPTARMAICKQAWARKAIATPCFSLVRRAIPPRSVYAGQIDHTGSTPHTVRSPIDTVKRTLYPAKVMPYIRSGSS